LIRSFKDTATESAFLRKLPAGLSGYDIPTARRKLRMLDAAADLKDLKAPPNNKLHPLKCPLSEIYGILELFRSGGSGSFSVSV
jgi:plasmid maintenance system killer protein